MKVLALLPMKGNSERVPNKNLKDFAGKPLYHRTMDVLLASKYIDKVIINTDSLAIKTDLLKRLSPEVIKKAYTAYMTISGEAESSEKTEQYFKDENKPITAWQDISLEEMVGRISGRVIGEYRGFQDDEGNTEQDRPMVRLLQRYR